MKLLSLCFLLSLLFSTSSFSKSFSSQYSQFELPPGWQCQLEGTEWVCQSENSNRKKEAIIILAAKIRGSQDSLDQYMAYLKQTKAFTLPGGKTQVSEAKYSKTKRINNHQWVDSLHLASEVPGFYTRYLATVKSDIGVAVTFSVAKDHYASYQPLFDKVIDTLRVFRKRNDDVTKFALKKKEENLLDESTFIPDASDSRNLRYKQKKKAAGTGGEDSSLLYIILAVVAGLVYMKMKKGKKGKGKSKKKTKKKKK